MLQEAVKAEELGVIPYELKLDYDYWNYRTHEPSNSIYVSYVNVWPDEVITALLPEDAQEEIPSGFAIVGHVGRLASGVSQTAS